MIARFVIPPVLLLTALILTVLPHAAAARADAPTDTVKATRPAFPSTPT